MRFLVCALPRLRHLASVPPRPLPLTPHTSPLHPRASHSAAAEEASRVREAASLSELEALLLGQEKEKLTVLHFFVEWAPPCRLSLCALARLSALFPAADFVSVDIDRVPEVVAKFGVDAVPKVLFVFNRERVGRMTGPTEKTLRHRIESLLESEAET